ncbi:hypothetical protein FQZ97_905570 [compost metagenome]
MPAAFEVDLKGLDEVVKKLRELGPKVERSALRRAARKAMNIVRDDARARVSCHDDLATAENIAKNIVVQESSRRSKAVGGVVMRVGVLGGARDINLGGLVGAKNLKDSGRDGNRPIQITNNFPSMTNAKEARESSAAIQRAVARGVRGSTRYD